MPLAIDLSGRVAIVTGGGRGIGQAVALALAQAGADVCLTARTFAEIEETAGMVRERGRNWITVPGAATRSAVAAEVVAKTIADLGGLHILVNNAGMELPKPLIDTTEDEYDRVMATNVKSMVLFTKAAGAHLIAQRFGRVVNVLADPSPEAADRLAAAARAQRQSGDFVVLSIHWGGNWGYDISRAHRAFAHRLIDAGAVDIVYGHSSYHPRPIEVYKGKPILYGRGDFLNDYEGIAGYEAFHGDLVLMYFATVRSGSGKLERLEMTPLLRIKNFRLQRAAADEAEWLRATLDRECRQFGAVVERTAAGDLRLLWG